MYCQSSSIVTLFALIKCIFGGSWKRPPLCSGVEWDSEGITIRNRTDLGPNSSAFFTDFEHDLYVVANGNENKILIWQTNQNKSMSNRWMFASSITGIFIFDPVSIYFSTGPHIHQTDATLKNLRTVAQPPIISDSCWTIFVDLNRTLYCSVTSQHQVITHALFPREYNRTRASVGGPASQHLHHPTGIYVDYNFDLYVADTGNRRIQVFRNLTLHGETYYRETTFTPKDIAMDYHGALWVIDQDNNKIYRCFWGHCPCFIGCSRGDLHRPSHLGFDQYGNLLVLDSGNNRIQTFKAKRNTCYYYRSPRLCKNATWNQTATTISAQWIDDWEPRNLFIDRHNHIYVGDHKNGRVLVWNHDTSPTVIPNINVAKESDIFVGLNGDIYFEHKNQHGQIQKYSMQEKNCSIVAQFDGQCYGLFVDNHNTLYCSQYHRNNLMKISMDDSSNKPVFVFGTGRQENAPDSLKHVWGIFIDLANNIYVADAGHHRIQRFQTGQLDAITVLRERIPLDLKLDFPTDILVYDTGYMIVADDKHHRIIRSNGKEWQCIVGCSGKSGSDPDQLNHAVAVQLDDHGNVYVADEHNKRIQKFFLIDHGCHENSLGMDPPPIVCQSSLKQNADGSLLSLCTSASSLNCVQPHVDCNELKDLCSITNPCQNNATCYDDNKDPMYYFCKCVEGTNGTNCENDYRICEPNPCLNGGTCQGTSKTQYNCTCALHWTGDRCERKVNYCLNRTCLNKGVCRPLFGGAKCECLQGSYEGEFCEIVTKRIIILRFVSKSFAFVAILALVSVALFIIIMDILKYGFGIDPVAEDREYLRRKKRRPKPKAIHYIYVNHPNDFLPQDQ